jgi:hypothetical protein
MTVGSPARRVDGGPPGRLSRVVPGPDHHPALDAKAKAAPDGADAVVVYAGSRRPG